jgi:hypothetical protein
VPTSPFVTLVFKGERFQGAMPVETLSELAAYRELVAAVARALFFERNNQRQRLPNGFEDQFNLVMTTVEDGSAVPAVLRVVPDGKQMLFQHPDLFDESRVLVEEVIAEVGAGRALPSRFPRAALPRFNAFGRTLRDDESIVVAAPGTREGSSYNRALGRQLVLLREESYEDEIDLLGRILRVGKEPDAFEFRSIDGWKVAAVGYATAHIPILAQAWEKDTVVRVRGTGLFNSYAVLTRIVSVSDVGPIEEGAEEGARRRGASPIPAQVDTLKALERGWFDEDSEPFDKGALDWFQTLLTGVVDAFRLPTPYLYPTPEGTARAEWSTPSWELIVNVELGQRSADLIASRVGSDDFEEVHIALTEPGGESRLGRFVQEHLS